MELVFRLCTSLRNSFGRLRHDFILGLAPWYAAALVRWTRGNEAHAAFSRYGFELLRRHYYLPIPDEVDLRDMSRHEPTELVGVNLNAAQALVLTDDLITKYRNEFKEELPLHKTAEAGKFWLINGTFMAGDAHMYYAFIRHWRPRRIVEIGGGNSTLLAAAACRRNRSAGVDSQLTVIEPFHVERLKSLDLDRLIEKRVQEVPLETFTSLEANDILFIDSSHALRAGGDVQFEYCEILPRLRPGVLVHIHDINLPMAYPKDYFRQLWYWNEQYVLQAFLAFNFRFEVLWPGAKLFVSEPARLLELIPEIAQMKEAFPSAQPVSFWMRVRDS